MDIESQIADWLISNERMIFGVAVLYALRKYIEAGIDGLMIFVGRTLDQDSYVIIDKSVCRIKKVGLTRTICQELNPEQDVPIELIVPNVKLKFMIIRKVVEPNPFAEAKKTRALYAELDRLRGIVEDKT